MTTDIPVDRASTISRTTGPVTNAERLVSVDTLRGFALLGILLMNVCGAGLAFGYNDPSVIGGAAGADLQAWIVTNLFFEGSMRTIFSMLFGASVLLLTVRPELAGGGNEIAKNYYRRTLWLIVFGLFNAYVLLWIGDILYGYGIAGLLLFPLRKLRARTLIGLGAAALLLITLKDGVYDYYHSVDLHARVEAATALQAQGVALSAEQEQALSEWGEAMAFAKPSQDFIASYTEGMHGGFVSVFLTQLPVLVYFQFLDYFPNGLFDVLGMMLMGMGLFKSGAFSAQWSARRYLGMLLLGYAVGIGVNAWEVRTIMQTNFDFLSFEKTNITYDLGRLGTALGHIALVMLLCKGGALAALRTRLAAVGQMALTNYLTQSVILTFTFTGVGLGLFAQLGRAELYYVVAIVWLIQLWWSPVWLRHFRFGPAEWVWRSLTYGRRQPMRLKSTASSPMTA